MVVKCWWFWKIIAKCQLQAQLLCVFHYLLLIIRPHSFYMMISSLVYYIQHLMKNYRYQDSRGNLKQTVYFNFLFTVILQSCKMQGRLLKMHWGVIGMHWNSGILSSPNRTALLRHSWSSLLTRWAHYRTRSVVVKYCCWWDNP